MTSVNNGYSAGVQFQDPSWTKYALVDREGRSIYGNFVVAGATFVERQEVLYDFNGAAGGTQSITAASIDYGTIRVNNMTAGVNLQMPTAAALKQAIASFAPTLEGVSPYVAAVAGSNNGSGSTVRSVRFTVINSDAADAATITASGATPGTDITVGFGSMIVAANSAATFEIRAINGGGTPPTFTYTVNRIA